MNHSFKKWTIIMVAILVMVGCRKDKSVENGNAFTTQAGGNVTKAPTGSCQNIGVFGTYVTGSPLNSNHFITVDATVTNTGQYNIYTDTVNGCWFARSGYQLITGPYTFTLQGYGKPILPIVSVFSVHFNQSVCTFSILPQ